MDTARSWLAPAAASLESARHRASQAAHAADKKVLQPALQQTQHTAVGTRRWLQSMVNTSMLPCSAPRAAAPWSSPATLSVDPSSRSVRASPRLALWLQVANQERSAKEPRSENMTIEEHLQESMESPAVRILGMLLISSTC